MAERDVQAEILLALGSRRDTRLFRNPVGTGWSGEVVSNEDGLVVLKRPRFLRYGLITGSGDLIGWHQQVITQADVGSTWARFLSVEVKAGRGTASDEQGKWKTRVNGAGGIAMVARSPEEALAALNDRGV
jgi:hypothetical protein